ncbi:aldehyde dehydrogenase (NAD+) [Rhodoferax antarcticus]|uniref:aldehyde dehydrogenase (NAD(+)) n=2 Tax=Rhodoferax antarcticus TaxID=81479 RepID=A0A1Q8YI57_9BURK|nr:aldehyde dehydrogenase family protein [Rhodoferax antarcticus]APW47950.1 aldehyde dehydrogenase family protein [Rhodoferax antarcticus]MCW2313282.1 aldehyde dehydrogenase (NAD+) [Rhodoferax antarcticus]OLP07748.1 aldehyde dehydrogenase family protein [Rhodoferax antarcticus ANT.BR]
MHIPVTKLMASLGVAPQALRAGDLLSLSPIDGQALAQVHAAALPDVASAVERAHAAYLRWRLVPAPQRGELVRLLGDELRANKQALGELVTLEVGKVSSEGLGEVQEMIDICDFAVGLSRQLYGLTIASERPGHRMMETWHPLGVVGVITAFNFPVAVWAWNAALALVCGDAVIWKPSEKAPLCALAVQALFERACQRFGQPELTQDLCQVLNGHADVGQALVDNPKVALISATGSTRMGRAVGQSVAARFGRSLLELGGNNAIIVAPSADLDMAVRAVAFAAAGTAGQRCTSARRLIVHDSVYDELVGRLKKAYASFTIGPPTEPATLLGPLIDLAAFEAMQLALTQAAGGGGVVTGGARVLQDRYADAFYVSAALVEMPAQTDVVRHETFAPILYVLKYQTLEQAIALNNEVPQGLSSAIFTTDLREAEAFMSAAGSDCGISNVNIGTSGAEIGGAFGGEKETGGGRESGSDAWRAYMRRATNTINYSSALPLAQGVRFDI